MSKPACFQKLFDPEVDDCKSCFLADDCRSASAERVKEAAKAAETAKVIAASEAIAVEEAVEEAVEKAEEEAAEEAVLAAIKEAEGPAPTSDPKPKKKRTRKKKEEPPVEPVPEADPEAGVAFEPEPEPDPEVTPESIPEVTSGPEPESEITLESMAAKAEKTSAWGFAPDEKGKLRFAAAGPVTLTVKSGDLMEVTAIKSKYFQKILKVSSYSDKWKTVGGYIEGTKTWADFNINSLRVPVAV